MANELPAGVVTFLMTDVEGSSALWRDSSHAAALMARQTELIDAAIAKHGGVRPRDQGEGDSTVAAFVHPRDALAAACAAQRALAVERWPGEASLRVRMAIHTGDAELRDDRNYGGLTLIRCARLRGLANGGQVLVSSTTAALAGERLPDATSLVALDTVPIADFAGPERVYQLHHPELGAGIAALRRPLAPLPVWPTPLVGREAERRALGALLGEQRVVTVTGAGGSGKTRLAHAVAEDLRERFGVGVVWVELARLSSGEQVAGVVVSACGAREVPGVEALELLARHLADAERLLVLDNCEHLVAGCAELVDTVVRAAPGVRVLATSREPLGVAGETSWRIPSLTVPEEHERDPERLAEADAVRLFAARARAARPDFSLDVATAPLVARICRRLDGIPLALELAAARVRTLSLERLAEGLDDRFRLLTGGSRTAVERQRTLLASVEWSHALLDEEERTLFRRLSVFAAPFAVEAAEAVAGDDDLDASSVLDLLARLVDKSLVLHEGDRYRMLETIRQYAQVRTDEAGELALLRDRQLDWFRRRARGLRLDREIGTTRQIAEVSAEAPDLVAAAEWAAGRAGRLPSEILHALAQAWGASDRFGEARGVGLRLLGALEPESRSWLEGLAPLAHLLVLAGAWGWDLGWQERARAALAREGAALDPVGRGFLEAALAVVPAYLGSREAQEGLVRAAALGREHGNAHLEASAACVLALVRAQTGDPAGARPLLAWLERHVGRDTWRQPFVSSTRALLALYDGDFAAAHRALESVAPGLPALTTSTLIAFWERDAGTLARLQRPLEALVPTGLFSELPILTRAQIALLDGDLDAAARALDADGELPSNFQLWRRLLRAEVALSLGDLADAARRGEGLIETVRGTQLHYWRAAGQVLMAQAARQAGNALEALSWAHAARADAVAHGSTIALNDALEVLAVLAGDRGEVDDAGRLLGAATAFRERSGYRWAPRHHERAIEELRERLPAAALAEGRALSLAEAGAYAARGRGRGERGRPDHGWESLTPSERRVVELVADGLANAAIAKKLFVSLATVKTHLVHVYGKLGLATRAELVAAAAKRRLEEE